eukprot:1936785-Prymnesium_polylepis.1
MKNEPPKCDVVANPKKTGWVVMGCTCMPRLAIAVPLDRGLRTPQCLRRTAGRHKPVRLNFNHQKCARRFVYSVTGRVAPRPRTTAGQNRHALH